MQRVEELDISGNNLGTIPDVCSQLRHLRKFNVAGTPAATLTEVNASKCVNCGVGNRLTALPGNIIAPLDDLEELNVSANSLTYQTLPIAMLQRLPRLRVLVVDGNPLRTEERRALGAALPSVVVS
jgi:hypothetical protein